jgi:hypothetical protein
LKSERNDMSRKIYIAAILGAAVCASSGQAAPGGCTNAPSLTPFAFETITVGATAVGFTATVYAPTGAVPADMAVVTTEDDAIRYREDGVDPTAAVGHVIAVDTAFTACGVQSIRNIRMIRVTTDASLSVSYYRIPN